MDVSFIVDLDKKIISGIGREFTITRSTETAVAFEAPYQDGERFGLYLGVLDRISGRLILKVRRSDNVITQLDQFFERQGNKEAAREPIYFGLTCTKAQAIF